MKIDHFVVNVDEIYQNDTQTIETIRKNKFPYEPKWGKSTQGFQVSDLWIGNEYLEMVRILKENGGGWIKEWTVKYNQGHRGLICLMLDVENIDFIYQSLQAKQIQVTSQEWLEFKWCFNLLTRRMPWRNCYLPFFNQVPFQIGFQEMKDEKARDFMNQYMVPNSRDNGITGIEQVAIKGQFTNQDLTTLLSIFEEKAHQEENSVQVKLNESQSLEFKKEEVYQVEFFIKERKNNSIQIENMTIHS